MNTTTSMTRLPRTHCILYRFVACLLLGASLINLSVLCRYFFKRYYDKKKSFVHNRLSAIMIGMSISSFLIITTAEPSILIQCFTCRPTLHDDIFCKIHGFLCFSIGLFNMHLVTLLSCLRYLSILHKSSWFYTYLEQHRDLCVLFCAVISICWSIPSLFNIGNRYVPEDSGFYCSLKWNDSAISSQLFIISIIFINYILPFFLVVYTNLRIWYILRRLLKSHHYSNHSSLHLSSALSTDNESLSIDPRKHLSDAQSNATTNRLQKLKIDQRYAFMTAIMAAQYVIIWTPYAYVVISKFTGHTTFIDHHPFLPTLSALFAKISLILNPLILLYTSKMTH